MHKWDFAKNRIAWNDLIFTKSNAKCATTTTGTWTAATISTLQDASSEAQRARYQGGQYDWLCTFPSLQCALCSALSISECVAVFFCSLVNCYSKRIWIIIPSGQTSSSKNEILASGTLNQLEVQLLLNYNRHTSGGGGRGRHYAPCIYLYFTKQEGCQKQHDYEHPCTT